MALASSVPEETRTRLPVRPLGLWQGYRQEGWAPEQGESPRLQVSGVALACPRDCLLLYLLCCPPSLLSCWARNFLEAMIQPLPGPWLGHFLVFRVMP